MGNKLINTMKRLHIKFNMIIFKKKEAPPDNQNRDEKGDLSAQE